MIYGFTGKKRSGKSTAAEYIQEKIGGKRHNFKAALINEIKQNFPTLLASIVEHMDKTQYDGWGWTIDRLFEEKPPLVRTLLQNYGTEVRRADDPDYWVNQWKLNLPKGNVIVDDVRFLNEAQAVKDAGGIIIRVERTDLPQTDSHSSETEMESIEADYTISVKTGQLDLLHHHLDFILEEGSTPKKLTVLHE